MITNIYPGDIGPGHKARFASQARNNIAKVSQNMKKIYGQLKPPSNQLFLVLFPTYPENSIKSAITSPSIVANWHISPTT